MGIDGADLRRKKIAIEKPAEMVSPKPPLVRRYHSKSYIEDNLMAGESLIYRAKMHWAVFLGPAFLLFLGLSFTVDKTPLAPLGGLLILVALLMAASAAIDYLTSEYGITSKRVVVKVGFIRRTSIEVLLNKVEGIQVEQGILGRILGFGSITVSGTGGAKNPFHKIADPLEFRKVAQEQIAIVQDTK